MITIRPCVPTRINHRWNTLDASGQPACGHCGAQESTTRREAEVLRYRRKRKGKR